jgi:predicted dehydrogenase
LNFAIIGCGRIGLKRAEALSAVGHTVRFAVDSIADRAAALAAQYPGAESATEWQPAFSMSEIDAAVVATTNQALAPATFAAVRAGKHVIVEKPAARNLRELDCVIAAVDQSGIQVQVGFNHRYHPALQQVRAWIDSGVAGPLMFLRARYGHGGRVGYEKEWRADPAISGGGELIDQGIHLIDLARWFLGDFARVEGHADTYFWEMPVDDNAFLNLRTAAGQTAWLHASCTEWKNLFSLEIYGRDAKLEVQGLGGSYGVERAILYQMRPEMGPPDTTIFEYPGEDRSWQLEIADFEESILSGISRGPTLYDARAALEIVECVYKRSGR